jgi:hypothetical protein
MIPTVKITVSFVDGAKSEVLVKPRTQIAFERKYNTSIGRAFDPESPAGTRLEYSYFLAHHASRASQDFDVWIDLVDGLEVEVEGSVDPTPSTPSDGS